MFLVKGLKSYTLISSEVVVVAAAGLTINDGDNLKYEIGAEAGSDGKFPITKVE